MSDGDLFEIMLVDAGASDTRVKLVRYRGVVRVDLRLYTDVAGQRVPTKRGVSLNADKLDDLIAALQAVQAKLTEVSP